MTLDHNSPLLTILESDPETAQREQINAELEELRARFGEMYTAQALADFFQVSLDTVRSWHRTGSLKGVKIGRVLRFQKDEVHDYMVKRLGMKERPLA